MNLPNTCSAPSPHLTTVKVIQLQQDLLKCSQTKSFSFRDSQMLSGSSPDSRAQLRKGSESGLFTLLSTRHLLPLAEF